MVAFKNYVNEKLPNIGYLSKIDWYVMLCFVLAFVIVFGHVAFRIRFNAFGLSEPMFTVGVNASWAASSASDSTGTPAHSWWDAPPVFLGMTHEPLIVGQPSRPWDDGSAGGDAADADMRYVQINALLACGLALWLLVHVLAALTFWAWPHFRREQDPFWHNPETAVWIGPLARPIGATPAEKTRIEEHVRRHFDGLVERKADVHNERRRLPRRTRQPVAARDGVLLWRAEEAKRQLCFDVTVPADAAPGEQICVRSPSTNRDVHVTVPQGVSAGQSFPHPKEYHEHYRHNQPFVVVNFTSPSFAKAALKRGVEKLHESDERDATARTPVFQSGCVIEPLNPAWHLLSKTFGHTDLLASIRATFSAGGGSSSRRGRQQPEYELSVLGSGRGGTTTTSMEAAERASGTWSGTGAPLVTRGSSVSGTV